MSPTRRKPGFPDPPRQHSVQPGNLNALKHGFYSRYFKANEVEAIQGLQDDDLREEIAALRVIMGRVLALSSNIDDVNTGLRLLSTFSAASQLSSLVKVQTVIQQDDTEDSFEDALRQAILKWHEMKSPPSSCSTNCYLVPYRRPPSPPPRR